MNVANPSTQEIRDLVRERAAKTYRRRKNTSLLLTGVIGICFLIALLPLGSILYNVVVKGGHFLTWNFLSTPQQLPNLLHKDAIGGVSDAISGSLIIDGLAILISVPIAMALAMALYEFRNRFTDILRTILQSMIGLPSILYGIFVYSFILVPLARAAGVAFAGSLALAIMMTPLMAIAGEAGLRDVPGTLKEAGLALGGQSSSVMRRVLLPYAVPRLLTGILLALSRAVGETAPILFVIGANLAVSWNLNGPVQALPTLIFNYLGSAYEYERQATWGMALILMITILFLNLLSRTIVSRMNKGRR